MHIHIREQTPGALVVLAYENDFLLYHLPNCNEDGLLSSIKRPITWRAGCWCHLARQGQQHLFWRVGDLFTWKRDLIYHYSNKYITALRICAICLPRGPRLPLFRQEGEVATGQQLLYQAARCPEPYLLCVSYLLAVLTVHGCPFCVLPNKHPILEEERASGVKSLPRC